MLTMLEAMYIFIPKAELIGSKKMPDDDTPTQPRVELDALM